MTASRVMSNRTNQRLEQEEASAREVEVLVSNESDERDELYEQLMQSLGSQATRAATPPPPAVLPSPQS
eukprot:6383918-Amphidinium_carterae.2